MTTGLGIQVGTTISVTKAISDADVALFALIADNQAPSGDDPAERVRAAQERTPVPGALVAALMVSAAAAHVGGIARAELARTEVRFAGLAWTDDTLTAHATVTAADDATHMLRVTAQCVNTAGQRLAEGQFELRYRA